MKKSFAGAPNGISIFPERGGATATLTGLDLTTEIAPGQIFQPAPLFKNNCKSVLIISFRLFFKIIVSNFLELLEGTDDH